jgi:uncharacterized membrane protein YeaQ/YmgE (transglycosylase-associated protein family)
MPQPDIAQTAMQLIDQLLIWIGFGTIVGLLAKAIMPGRDPGGAVATLIMGIAGTVIGCAVLMYLTGGQRVSPITPLGFVVGTAGSFVILFFYRLLAGYLFFEDRPLRRPYYRSWGVRRRRGRDIIIEE